jgi:hypothetical protein
VVEVATEEILVWRQRRIGTNRARIHHPFSRSFDPRTGPPGPNPRVNARGGKNVDKGRWRGVFSEVFWLRLARFAGCIWRVDFRRGGGRIRAESWLTFRVISRSLTALEKALFARDGGRSSRSRVTPLIRPYLAGSECLLGYRKDREHEGNRTGKRTIRRDADS